MWINKMFLLTVFIFLMISPSVNASITVTVTAPSSVTQGSNIPISASFVAGQDGDSGTFYFSCDQTVSGEVDPQSGYSIVSSSSKTYTFTPNTAQTYSNCKVSDGGSQYSSIFAVNVVAPSTLTVSGSPSSTTNNSGDTFSLIISITNPAASAVTTSYSLGCSSHTCSGDQTSDTISILAGATTTLQWTVTVGSSSGNITFQLGSNSNAFTSSVTVPSTTTTTIGGGDGGGGGGGGAATTKISNTTTAVTTITTSSLPTTTQTVIVTTTIPSILPYIPTELGGIPIWIPVVIIAVIVIIVAVWLMRGHGSKTHEKDIREKFTLLEF